MPVTVANCDAATKQSEAAHGVRLWALVGPTATGKSGLAVKLARARDMEVVGCDSVQCYRGFRIGAATPSAASQQGVPHHLIGFFDPRAPAPLDAAHWSQAARACIDAIRQRGRQPMLCGGTGLYARALRLGLAAVGSDPAVRRAWQARESASPGAVWAALNARDADSARRIGPHNPARLLRALEMVLTSGRPVADVWAAARPTPTPLATVALDARREWLLPRIEERTRAMVAAGLLDEVESLLALGVAPEAPPMRAVGYREARAVLAGLADAGALEEAIVARTWQYVRRQRTWLRREPDVVWLDAEQLATLPEPAARATLEDAFLLASHRSARCPP